MLLLCVVVQVVVGGDVDPRASGHLPHPLPRTHDARTETGRRLGHESGEWGSRKAEGGGREGGQAKGGRGRRVWGGLIRPCASCVGFVCFVCVGVAWLCGAELVVGSCAGGAIVQRHHHQVAPTCSMLLR